MRIITIFIFTFLLTQSKAQQIDWNATVHSNTLEDTFDLPWPSWVFSHWVWEDESTQESALQLVDEYIAHDIPISAIIIDSPWETGYNTFEWDTALFHDAQNMIDSLHSRDVKVLLWITGIINIDEGAIYDYARDQGYFMKVLPFDSEPAVVNWWKGDGSLLDWFNPDAVTWWKGLMHNMLDMGIDGWKCDGTDFSAIQTPWSDGAGNFVSRLDYSHAYYQIHFDYTREVLGDDRVIHARPIDNYGLADIGGSQVSFSPVPTGFAAWVGDQDATFEGLTWALNSMYHSSDMGYLSFGSDIGGYRENDLYPGMGRSKELFIRWAQLGTFCGLMENGGGGEHRPWMFDQETEDIYRDLVQKRYNMINYLMVHSESVYANQQSLMQFFNKIDYSYMLGPDIFVAPFLTEGTEITVNFPSDGNWTYVYDYNLSYQGGTTSALTIPYTEYPVFFRSGTSPLDVEEMENGLSIFPNPSNGIFNLTLNQTENISIEVLNITGQTIYSVSGDFKTHLIDLSGQQNGVYICVVTGPNGERSFVKLVRS